LGAIYCSVLENFELGSLQNRALQQAAPEPDAIFYLCGLKGITNETILYTFMN